MKKEALLSAIMLVVTLTVTADEYIDPQTNVVYIYEPGQTTASVKAGYGLVENWDSNEVLQFADYPGSPDAAGDIVILDRFTIGTEEYVVTSIGERAFQKNKSIKTIIIPETVTDIGEGAFRSCDSLTTVQLPESLTQIANILFYRCGQLVSVNLPSSVRSIGNYAFERCSSLASLVLPVGLTFVGFGAFIDTPWYAARYAEAPDGPFYISPVLLGYKGDKPTGDLVISEGTTCICYGAFGGCDGLTSITIPSSVVYVGEAAFDGCSGITSVTIGNKVDSISYRAFRGCKNLSDVYCYAMDVPEAKSNTFYETNIKEVTLHVPAASVSAYQAVEPWKNFKQIVALPAQDDYRPFVEEGKVWKVGNTQAILDNSVHVVDYYYFDGDTIIGGKTCKQMMCQRFVGPGFSDEYGYWTPQPFLRKVGAWYEEDQKVYFYDETTQSMVIKYDFSLGDYETVDFLYLDGYPPYIIGPKQTGGIEGFKGVYRDIMMGQDINTKTPWLEGVGGLDGPFSSVYHPLADSKPDFLMSCVVGDEVIYLNDRYEDGATPESVDAKKRRFDFNHTVKTQPKTPNRRGEEAALYGEYNDKLLDIRLDPLDDAYVVRITNQKTGETLYEKAINAGNIVALNIDISKYPEGQYEITIDNSNETFNGVIDTTTGIDEIVNGKSLNSKSIYNLQGQRMNSLQKGFNIIEGKKIFVK